MFYEGYSIDSSAYAVNIAEGQIHGIFRQTYEHSLYIYMTPESKLLKFIC